MPISTLLMTRRRLVVRLLTQLAMLAATIACTGFGSLAHAVFPRHPDNDFDGDGISDVAVFRPGSPSSTSSYWYILPSTGTCANMKASNVLSGGFAYGCSAQWGLYGDTPIVADYDGDGLTDFTVVRPGVPANNNTLTWFFRYSKPSNADFTYSWGVNGDIVDKGDYDADSKTDITVYRYNQAKWFTHRSTDGADVSFQSQLLFLDVHLAPISDLWSYPASRYAIAPYLTSNSILVFRQDRTGSTYTVSGNPVPVNTSQAYAVRGDFGGWASGSHYNPDQVAFDPPTGVWRGVISGTSSCPPGWNFLANTTASDGTANGIPAKDCITQWGDYTGGADIAVSGDYDGDHIWDLMVFHPATAEWILRPSSGKCPPSFCGTQNGYTNTCDPSLYVASYWGGCVRQWGLTTTGDKPLGM